MRAASLLVIVMFLGPVALAQGTEAVLVPLLVSDLPGAYGSLWSSELRIHNSGNTLISFGEISCTLGFCSFYEVPPHSTTEPLAPYTPRPTHPGTSLFVSGQDLESLSFSLRVFDTSRTKENWGASVPVVRWRDVTTRTLRFIGITTASGFRHTLRVYRLGPAPAGVTVRYFDDDRAGTPALWDGFVPFHTLETGEGYTEISSVLIPGLAATRVRIEVESPDLPIWGMVSVTNIDTQAVTIVASQ